MLALASAVDFEGARHVHMNWWMSADCCKGHICMHESEGWTGAHEDTQAGGIGSSVSDGIWVYHSVRPQDCCPRTWRPVGFRFAWHTLGEDFHGNTAEGDSGVIVYP
jgi:hypothetical protein